MLGKSRCLDFPSKNQNRVIRVIRAKKNKLTAHQEPKPMNIEEISKKIVATFRPFNPEKIILFGSSVKGNLDCLSDVDVIVVYSTDKPFMSRLRDLYESWDIPKAVDILAYTPDEFQEMLKHSYFVQHAVNEGEVIYERARERG